jgi:transcriptional regulator with XRE-family HTH domain
MGYTPRFKECRLAAGLTQQEAAARLGKTPSAIQKWEQGKNSPTMNDIRRLADAYHIEPFGFFLTANCLMLTVDEHEHVANDASIFVSFPHNGRDRLLSQLKECGAALSTVPQDFADHWIAGLKACASIIAHEMTHSLQEQTRVQSQASIEPAKPGANDGNPPPGARRRSTSRVPRVPGGRIP